MRDIEEWAWVVDTLNRGTTDAPSGLGEPKPARRASAETETAANETHELANPSGICPAAAGLTTRSVG